MAETETVAGNVLDEMHEKYLAARQAFKETQKKFAALAAGYKDICAPQKLSARLENGIHCYQFEESS